MTSKPNQPSTLAEGGESHPGGLIARISPVDWSGEEQQAVQLFFKSSVADWPAQPIQRRMQGGQPQPRTVSRKTAEQRVVQDRPT